MFKLALKRLPIDTISKSTSVKLASQLNSNLTIQEAVDSISNCGNIKQTISVTGQAGSGTTTFAQGLIHELICNGFTSPSDVLYLEIGQYDREESLWNTAVEIAKNRNDRDTVTLLASGLKKKEEKFNAVVSLLNNFKMICFDNLKAGEKNSFCQTVLTLIKCLNTVVIGVSNPEAVLKDANLNIKVCGISPEAARSLVGVEMSDEVTQSMELSYRRLQYNPEAVQLYMKSCLEFDAYTVPELTSQEMAVGKVIEIIWRFLNQTEKSALSQLSELRQDLPIAWHHVETLARLIRLGLVKYKAVRSGRLAMVSVSNSLQYFLHNKYDLSCYTQDPNQFDVLDSWMMFLGQELQGLVMDAKKNSWPFIPEKWQYVTDAGEKESYNVKDLLTQKNKDFSHLSQCDILQECLHHSIVRKNYGNMAAIIFVLDRFIYWQGGSEVLLSIVDSITKGDPSLAIAPQLVIRKARILRTSGDLQGAEKVLDNILYEKQKLGCWQYKENHDHHLVKAVCIQIKGEIQALLGQWLTAATHLLDSINLFKTLPKVDKKGLSCSLSLLVNTLQNMSSDDYQTIAKQYSLTSTHPYLQAYDFAWEAADLARFTPLFYARHKRRAGEMMLEYAKLMPATDRSQFVVKALEELKESLKAHKSLDSLNSREQYYEFIAASYKTCCVYELYEEHETAQDLKGQAVLLYEHYCRHQTSVVHDSFSQGYVNNLLSILGLPLLTKDKEGTFGTMPTMSPNFTQSHTPMKTSSEASEHSNTVDRCATTLQTLSISKQPTVDRLKTTILTVGKGGNATDDKINNDFDILDDATTSVHECLSSRYDAIQSSWKTQKTLVYIGEQLKVKEGKKGAQRDPLTVEYLNQDEPLGKYVGKRYKKFRGVQQYEEDVRCQMTARYYVGLFNQELYHKGIEVSHIQFLPVVMLHLLDTNGNKTEAVYNVEPYIHGDFTKLTNNWSFVDKEGQGSKLVLAFSHYTHDSSNQTMVIVDHQGWTSSDHLSTTFLTDPQIHSLDTKLYGTGNLGEIGIDTFWKEMHPTCNEICQQLGLVRPEGK